MARATRVKRNPIKDTFRNRQFVKGKDPNYEYRFVNDEDDRLSIMKERGWEVVVDKDIQIGDKRVADPTSEGTPRTISGGGGLTQYLMRIPKDWYEEDQAVKREHIQRLEDSIKPTKEQRADGFYGEVSIKK